MGISEHPLSSIVNNRQTLPPCPSCKSWSSSSLPLSSRSPLPHPSPTNKSRGPWIVGLATRRQRLPLKSANKTKFRSALMTLLLIYPPAGTASVLLSRSQESVTNNLPDFFLYLDFQ